MLLVLVLALAGAGALGLMGQSAGDGEFRGSREFARLGGPWLVAGFLGGAVAGWRRRGWGFLLGALAGALIVGAGSVAYYAIAYLDGGNPRTAAKLGIGWGLAGLGVGGVLGLVGAAFSTSVGRHASVRWGRPIGSWLQGAALGTLGGLLVGEAIALLWVWESPGLRTMAVLEGLGGGALVIAGCVGRSWRFVIGAVTFAAIAATVGPIATTVLRETLRLIGWAGA